MLTVHLNENCWTEVSFFFSMRVLPNQEKGREENHDLLCDFAICVNFSFSLQQKYVE